MRATAALKWSMIKSSADAAEKKRRKIASLYIMRVGIENGDGESGASRVVLVITNAARRAFNYYI